MLSRVRLVPSALAALLASLLILAIAPAPANAVAPRHRHGPGKAWTVITPEVEATAAAAIDKPLRQRVDVSGAVPTNRQHAWEQFQRDTGGGWIASWDRATSVPSRLWGGSLWMPGTSASPDLAAFAARYFLDQHLELLAPGLDLADLELVSNHDDGTMRSIGFIQRHGGHRVVGGQISVRIKNDRLFVVSSQIFPDVAVDSSKQAAPHAEVVDHARAASVRALGLDAARAVALDDTVIVPLVGDDAVLGYRLAVPVDVDAGIDGRWTVYADPASGEPLVRENQLRWATGTVVFDVPVRWPTGGRADLPADRARVTVDGAAATTGADGALTWAREQAVPLVTSVQSNMIVLTDAAGGSDDLPEATANLTISPLGIARWSEAGDPLIDAQLTTFVHTQIVKAFTRGIITDPDTLEFINGETPVKVNINDNCNAFYTGGTINFFQSNSQCENTGLLADVIYHEFGHGIHDYSIIAGVGFFDPAMSEGASDFLSAIITGDPGMGRGFFFDGEALRHLDEPGRERVWPDDVSEIHETGIIFGGAFWDLRVALIASLGELEAIPLVNRLYVAALQRATDIPSSLIEVLAADDDDGDLGNGTPHECLIREAFGRHGLRTVTATVAAPGAVAGTTDESAASVVVTVGNLSLLCPGDEIAEVTLSWDKRPGSDTPAADSAIMTALPSGDIFTGLLTLPEPGDIVEYRVTVRFTDGTTMQFPDNRGDPDYELYRGDLIELYCTDFESDPFDDGWSHDATAGEDLWEWGAPQGIGADPAVAYSGDSVVGLALSTGLYEADAVTALTSPVIDVGAYSDVRLHYRRWLGVEDAFYDKATIYANGEIAWQNFDSGQSLDASSHTRDKEWVFRDVSLSTRIYDGTVELMFELASDGGLEFGGWTIDDLCIVADPNAICGDGTINGVEQCDEGDDNADLADTCRSNCRQARCGDAIVDSIEECDDGNRADGDGCSDICTLPGDGGCCSASDDPSRALAPLGLIALGLLVGRRRRKRS